MMLEGVRLRELKDEPLWNILWCSTETVSEPPTPDLR